MREKIERALQRWLDAALARIDGRLDNVSLRSKLYSIFVFCVLCPLVLTDSIVMWMLYDTEHKSRQQTMENTAEAVAYELNTTIDAAVDLAQMIYQNRYINEFLQGSYPTPLDYYIAYNDLMEESLYEVVMGNSAYQTVIYADNPRFHQRRLLCPPVQRAGGKLVPGIQRQRPLLDGHDLLLQQGGHRLPHAQDHLGHPPHGLSTRRQPGYPQAGP